MSIDGCLRVVDQVSDFLAFDIVDEQLNDEPVWRVLTTADRYEIGGRLLVNLC